MFCYHPWLPRYAGLFVRVTPSPYLSTQSSSVTNPGHREHTMTREGLLMGVTPSPCLNTQQSSVIRQRTVTREGLLMGITLSSYLSTQPRSVTNPGHRQHTVTREGLLMRIVPGLAVQHAVVPFVSFSGPEKHKVAGEAFR